jgi:hypothetical protein
LSASTPPDNGACKGQPVQWWFPNLSNMLTPKQRAETRQSMNTAVKICDGCLVKKECLDYSLHWEPFGIWGGLTEGARERMRKQRNIMMKRPSVIDILGGVPRA